VTAASVPICVGCEQALRDAGIGAASVLKSGNPMSMSANMPRLSIGTSAAMGGGIGAAWNAAGGSLLYPNKANINMMQSVHEK
jgi:hypothetical protein